jgi:hypothetical protein
VWERNDAGVKVETFEGFTIEQNIVKCVGFEVLT